MDCRPNRPLRMRSAHWARDVVRVGLQRSEGRYLITLEGFLTSSASSLRRAPSAPSGQPLSGAVVKQAGRVSRLLTESATSVAWPSLGLAQQPSLETGVIGITCGTSDDYPPSAYQPSPARHLPSGPARPTQQQRSTPSPSALDSTCVLDRHSASCPAPLVEVPALRARIGIATGARPRRRPLARMARAAPRHPTPLRDDISCMPFPPAGGCVS